VDTEQSIVIAGPSPTPGLAMKILAAEDNPVFQSMLRSLLNRWGYEAIIARNGHEAWEVLRAPDAPRLAVLDWMMPGVDGVELCRRVRAAGREPYIYILLLTARAESQDLVEGMEAGADDYLTKPFNSHELRVRLRAGIRILDLQHQLLEAREALRDQATHDGLTGLLNRSAILEKLDAELSRGSRESQPLSLLMVDLDRFKLINDTYGHIAGDSVLREAAHRMKSVMRRYDAVGRYGGEEFLIVLAGCGGEDAIFQAQRICDAISSEPFEAAGTRLPVTCSIGVSSRHRPCSADAWQLVHEADEALYTAKSSGRNRVEVSAFAQAGSPIAVG
jgi:two-component system cell cycle response regulator